LAILGVWKSRGSFIVSYYGGFNLGIGILKESVDLVESYL